MLHRERKEDIENLEQECCIRGYYIYEEIWESTVGEWEPSNSVDWYAIAVVKDDVVVDLLWHDTTWT